MKIFMFLMPLELIKFPIMQRIALLAKFYDELNLRSTMLSDELKPCALFLSKA